MNAIGDVLPFALGVAVSPIPVIAAILMLLSPKAKATSVGFAFGWTAGILIAVTVAVLASSAIPDRDDEASRPVLGVIQLLQGLLLLFLAVRQWRKRPKPGEEAALPRWMQAIDTMKFPQALGLGFLLAAVNPKNLLLAVTAGVAIGSAGLGAGGVVLTIVVFTVLAASTVLVPVVGYLLAAEKMHAPLESLRVWLSRENALIMAVLLLVIGIQVLGKGIGQF